MTGNMLMRSLKSASFADGVMLFLACNLIVAAAGSYWCASVAELDALDPVAAVAARQMFSTTSVQVVAYMFLSAYIIHSSLRRLGTSSRILRWTTVPYLVSFAVVVCLHVRKLVLVALSRQCYAELDVVNEDTVATVVCPNIFGLTSDDLRIYYDAPSSYVHQLIYIAGILAIGIFSFFYLRVGDYIGQPLAEGSLPVKTSDETSEKATAIF